MATEKIAEANQFFESLVLVVNKALGGKDPEPKRDAKPEELPQTADQLEAILRRHLG